MAVVYVKNSCAVQHDGATVTLRRGVAWDSDAPLVKAYPGLFEDEPVKVQGRGTVERATKAPGEKRAVGPRKTGE